MRLLILRVCFITAAVVFVTTLAATASHRSLRGPDREYGGATVREYLWALVPWVMMAGCAVPAVRLILARP